MLDCLLFVVHLREERGAYWVSLKSWKQLQRQETVSIEAGFPFLCSHTAGVKDYLRLPSVYVIRCEDPLPVIYSLKEAVDETFVFLTVSYSHENAF